VRDWLAGRRALPTETRRYVYAITGRDVDEWSGAKEAEPKSSTGCLDTLAALKVPPNAFAYRLEHQVTMAIAKPWAIKLAAGFSREQVLSGYSRAIARFGETIGHHDPIVAQSVLRSRGVRPFYQAQVGFDTRKQADSLCEKLRKAGGACFVTRMSQSASRE
jgi:SPOR domain